MPRCLLAACGLFVALLFVADARGSVSIAVAWDALLHDSAAAAVVTPVESRGVWENGRIYTYTRVRVDRAVAGDLATGGDAWVRTTGGVVGKVGQIVEGEAVLAPGHASLVFLHAGPVGAYEVTARAQGQFPVVTVAADATRAARTTVVRSRFAGAVLTPHATTATLRLAADVVHGRALDDVASEIAGAWGHAHAP